MDWSKITRILFVTISTNLAMQAYGDVAECNPTDVEVGERSKEYFDRVRTAAANIDNPSHKPSGFYAKSLERYGDRILDLDTLNVDDEVVDWAFDIADRMYNIAAIYRDIGMRVAVATQAYAGQPTYRFYWQFLNQSKYQPGWFQGALATRHARKFRDEQRREIRRSEAELKRRLAKKYGV